MGCGLAILAAIVVAVVVVAFMVFGPDDADLAEADASELCRRVVRERLKAPASAQFRDEQVMSPEPKRWEVAGSVDSQNTFGALVATRYTCTVRRDEAGKVIRVVDIKVA